MSNDSVMGSAAVAAMREALQGMLDVYCQLVESGDAGFWNPEDVLEVQNARAALKLAGDAT